MYRYRSPQLSTNKLEEKLHHIEKLGKIKSVKGYRFHSHRGTLYTNYECVLVTGENGTARFYGCWGYGGSGPHFVRALLLKCGVGKEVASSVAFESRRHDADGTDWIVSLEGGEPLVAVKQAA